MNFVTFLNLLEFVVNVSYFAVYLCVSFIDQ